jgi:hypothetical protein
MGEILERRPTRRRVIVEFSITEKARKIRRSLPNDLKAVAPHRRIFVLRQLVGLDGEAGKVAALKTILDLPERYWRMLTPGHVADLLDAMPWLDLKPSAIAPVEDFEHDGVRYFFPADNFENGTCLEYPIADEYITAFAVDGDAAALRKLTATLCREAEPDSAAALRRGDARVKLHSRAEVEARAARLETLPIEWQMCALFYFVGVKTLIHRMYGAWLFKQPETDDDGNPVEEAAQSDGLGWWGLYMDSAAGDVQKLDAIEQSNFHTFCLMEVRRRKQQQQADMANRINSPDFGENPS